MTGGSGLAFGLTLIKHTPTVFTQIGNYLAAGNCTAKISTCLNEVLTSQ